MSQNENLPLGPSLVKIFLATPGRSTIGLSMQKNPLGAHGSQQYLIFSSKVSAHFLAWYVFSDQKYLNVI